MRDPKPTVLRPGTRVWLKSSAKRFYAAEAVVIRAENRGQKTSRSGYVVRHLKKPAQDLRAYRPETLPEHLRWKGEGPPPASWYATDGTKVYRSYGDYCDD